MPRCYGNNSSGMIFVLFFCSMCKVLLHGERLRLVYIKVGRQRGNLKGEKP
jgi:hypothetical protein